MLGGIKKKANVRQQSSLPATAGISAALLDFPGETVPGFVLLFVPTAKLSRQHQSKAHQTVVLTASCGRKLTECPRTAITATSKQPQRAMHVKVAAKGSLSLACPYLMHDPSEHSRCAIHVLARIKDVKQHLARRHMLPIYCPRCFGQFSTEDDRDEHVQQPICTRSEERRPSGITAAQKARLERRLEEAQTVDEQWFEIWDILFPEAPRPISIRLRRQTAEEPQPCDHQSALLTRGQEGQKSLDLAKDSGYGSVARPHSIQDRPQQDSEMDANILSADQPQSALDGLELLALDPDDISSQSSVETSIDEMTGKTLIGLGLSENIHFRDICEKILNEFGRDRFVHQLRISLKAFHENLREDAADEAQMATARLLKSRRGRLRISNQIVARLDNLHEEPDTRPSQGSIDRVETWLAGLQTSNHGHDPEDREGFETNVAVEYSDSEVDDDDLPQNVTQLKKAILGTRAFRLIMRDLTMLFLPKSLRHVLTSVPKTDIDLATSQDTGRINRSKLLFTKLTGITWNWWPLSPPRRVLTAGEARLSWKCVSLVPQSLF